MSLLDTEPRHPAPTGNRAHTSEDTGSPPAEPPARDAPDTMSAPAPGQPAGRKPAPARRNPAGRDRTGTDSSGTDSSGTDRPGSDRPGADRLGTDRPGTDRPGTDRSGSGRPGSDRPGRKLDRATIRKVLDRHETVSNLSGDDLRLAAHLMGADPSVRSVVEASLSNTRPPARSVIKDLATIRAEQSDMDALLLAIELPPDGLRALNGLVATLANGQPARLHTSHAKAARQVTVAARTLDTSHVDRVETVQHLIT